MNNAIAVVAENLAQAHEALSSDLRNLQAAVNDPALSTAELQQALAVVQQHLAEHFRFEEENGYMTAVQRRQPQRARDLEKLRQEHQELARSMAELLSDCGDRVTVPDLSKRRIRLWIKQVKGHEARENSLVQEAFNLDISAED